MVKKVVLFLCLGLGIVAVINLLAPKAETFLSVATGYVAKELCSCIFVVGRDQADCAFDLPGETAAINYHLIEADENSAPGVEAGFLYINAVALFDKRRGCTIQ